MLSKYDIVRAGNSLVNWKEFLHLQENIKSKSNKNILEDVMGYYQLRRIVSSKLNRVL